MGETNELAREVRPIHRMREEEAQRRHDAVYGRHWCAIALLLDLEASQIVGSRCIRGASKEARQSSDITEIVALSLSRETAHIHVVDQPVFRRAILTP
jgi:hypothetical protein